MPKTVIEIGSGLLATVVAVLGWIGVSPSPAAPTAASVATPAAVVATAVPSATPALRRVGVPSLIGLKEDEAQSALKARGLRVGKVTTKAVEGVREGVVIAQEPQSGREVPYGGTVDLTLSKEPDRKPRRDD